jgi:hypothetical protein
VRIFFKRQCLFVGLTFETKETSMTPLRLRMIEDMRTAGLASVRRMKADSSDVRKVSPSRAMPGSAAA